MTVQITVCVAGCDSTDHCVLQDVVTVQITVCVAGCDSTDHCVCCRML